LLGFESAIDDNNGSQGLGLLPHPDLLFNFDDDNHIIDSKTDPVVIVSDIDIIHQHDDKENQVRVYNST
jgi:hypothetical protein